MNRFLRTPQLHLSDEDKARLRSAIDSHIYWQLSDERYRNDGAVIEPGSDDPDTAEEIAAFEELQEKLT